MMRSPVTSAFINFTALATRRHRVLSSRTRIPFSNDYFDRRGDDAEQHHQDRFNEMEYRNWEQGYEVYDQGFGPLTQQTISTLLASADFPPLYHGNDHNDVVRFLDVATGPGFVLSAAVDALFIESENNLRQQKKQYQLTGLDISKKFLTLAKERIHSKLRLSQEHMDAKNNVHIELIEGSAELLPFPENTFDSIVCNFGILHFFEPNSFLRESYRTLRPGGRISFSAWAPPARTEGFQIALSSIAEAGNPNVVGLPEGPNFFAFGDAQHAVTTLQSIGFGDVHSVELGEMKWRNIKDGAMLYDVLLTGTSRTREILLGQTPVEAAAIKSLMSEKYILITDSGKVPLAMPAVITSGRKPE